MKVGFARGRPARPGTAGLLAGLIGLDVAIIVVALLAGVLDRYLAADLDTDPDASAPTRDRVAR